MSIRKFGLTLAVYILLSFVLALPSFAQTQPEARPIITVDNANQLQLIIYLEPGDYRNSAEIDWSPDGTGLVEASPTGVRVYHVFDDGIRTHAYYARNFWTSAVAYSRVNHLVAGANSQDGTIWLWDANTGQQAAALATGNYHAERIAFSHDDRLLAVANGFEQGVTLWGIGTNTQRQPFTAANAYRVVQIAFLDHESYVHDILFASPPPDTETDPLLFTLSSDDRVRVWDTRTMAVIQTFAHDDVSDFAITRDGQQLVTSTPEGEIRVWDVQTGDVIGEFRIEPADFIFSLDINSDGTLLAVGTRFGVLLIDIESGETVSILRGFGDNVSDLAFSPDGTLLAALEFRGGGIHIWGIGSELSVLPTVTPTPRPTLTPSPVPVLTIGGEATVYTTGSDVLNIRSGAGRSYEIVARLSNGATVTLIGGPQEADGLTWWQIRTSDGIEGWGVEFVDDEQTLIPR